MILQVCVPMFLSYKLLIKQMHVVDISSKSMAKVSLLKLNYKPFFAFQNLRGAVDHLHNLTVANLQGKVSYTK